MRELFSGGKFYDLSETHSCKFRWASNLARRNGVLQAEMEDNNNHVINLLYGSWSPWKFAGVVLDVGSLSMRIISCHDFSCDVLV